MTPLSVLVKRASNTLSSNSPVILTALGISGVVTTAYLAHQAATKIAKRDYKRDPYKDAREYVQENWTLYIPTFVSGAIAIGCIVGATKVSARKTAAITAAYSISEKAFNEYKEKVVEKIGENKERAVRDEIAEDHVKKNPPPPPGQTIIAAGGNVLCLEMYTGRYFQSDMDTLQKAVNQINDKLNRDLYATLSDWYYILGLRETQYSDDIGWEAGKLMELSFTTVMSEDGRPCLAFTYNYISPLD